MSDVERRPDWQDVAGYPVDISDMDDDQDEPMFPLPQMDLPEPSDNERLQLWRSRRAELFILATIVVMLAFVTLQWGLAVGTGFIFGALEAIRDGHGRCGASRMSGFITHPGSPVRRDVMQFIRDAGWATQGERVEGDPYAYHLVITNDGREALA